MIITKAPIPPVTSDCIAHQSVWRLNTRGTRSRGRRQDPSSRGRVPVRAGSLEGGSHHPALDGLRWAPVSHQGHRRLILGAGQEAAQLGHLRGKGRWSAPRQTKRTHNVCDRVRNSWLLSETSKHSTCLPCSVQSWWVTSAWWSRPFLHVGALFQAGPRAPVRASSPGSGTVHFTGRGQRRCTVYR